MPTPFSKVCEENVDKDVFAPVKVCNEVNNDKQEVEWISYDVHPSKLGQLSGRAGGQVLLPLIPEECTFTTWVLQRTILTEDILSFCCTRL